MIAKLTGRVDTLNDASLVVDVNGVGYLVSCSARTLENLVIGNQVTLLIETVMRAESLHLFGFANQEEQVCFRLLTTVQGVGMRMALSLLSTLSTAELYQAIGNQDKASLTRAEGVGPKLASRIITELKDKIPTDVAFMAKTYAHPSSLSPNLEEAASALINLGYRRLDAVTAVSKAQLHLGEDAQLSDLIRQGLSLLGRTGT